MEPPVDDEVAFKQPEPLPSGPEVEVFANALDDCLSLPLSPSEKQERILAIPQKYYNNTLRRLNLLRPTKTRNSDRDDVDMDTDEADGVNDVVGPSEEVKKLENEVQTWDLLRRLLPLRYSTDASEQARSTKNTTGSQSELFHDFLQSDPLARERHAVLRWLQSNASSGPDIDEVARDLQRNADRGDIIAHGWLHTRSSIKLRKSVTAWPHLLDRQAPNIANSFFNSDGAPAITQLDPDAPTRQGRKLEPQDEYFERSIWLGCYEHLRRGSSLREIREWCQERTEMWRAISISVMLLTTDDKELSSECSPESLALWRRMCFGLARNGGCDDYERAVYGILSGDISSVEKVAMTWDNFMFANFNALLRTQLDNFILGRCPPGVVSNLNQAFSVFDAMQFHGDEGTVEKRLVHSLETHRQVSGEANEPAKALQASLIARETSKHLFEQGVLMATTEEGEQPQGYSAVALLPELKKRESKYFSADDHDGLRIVAHVYVLIHLVEKLGAKSQGSQALSESPLEWRRSHENIVASYTKYLRLANLHELIPLYCSILEAPRRYEVLSSNLIYEDKMESRRMQLKLVRKAGIDELEFVKAQARTMLETLSAFGNAFLPKSEFSILEPGPPDSRRGRIVRTEFFGEDEDDVDVVQRNLIRSVEWLLLVDKAWPDVFIVGTKIYKYLLRHVNINAARMLSKKVPFKEVVRKLSGQEEVDVGWYDDVGYWAEHLERYEITDVSPESVTSQARNFRELESLVRALDNLETMASHSLVSEDMPASNRDFWNKTGEEITKTKDSMVPLLSNWLVTGIEEGDKELKDIRKMYLPETILTYTSALHFAGTGLSRDHLLECMELAAVIAERNSNLATSFVEAGRMKELLASFAACSKALAVAAGEKRATGSSSKKLREMGWSRDLWAVNV